MASSDSLPRPSLLEHLRLAARVDDLAWTLERLHRDYGPVVDVGYRIPIRVVCVFGPEANQHLLADNADNFLWGEAFRLLEVVDGPTALVLSDGSEHRRRRRLVQPAFAVKRVDAHADLIVAELDRTLAGWRPGRRLDAHTELRAAIRRIVVRALFGNQMGDLADEIGERLEPALRYVQRTPLSRLDIDLRWNGYGRARAAARAVDELTLAEVARRRSEGVDAVASPDALSALLVAAQEVDGGEVPLGDAEVCDQIRSLTPPAMTPPHRRRAGWSTPSARTPPPWQLCVPRCGTRSATGRPPSTICGPCRSLTASYARRCDSGPRRR